MGSQAISNKPWLDSQGNAISTSKLKEVSKEWTADTWEQYLCSIEAPRYESILGEEHFSSISEMEQVYQDDLRPPATSNDLKKYLKNLTSKQQKIIFLIFWEGLTNAEIASRMNISTTAVQKLKVRGLNSLKEQIEGVTTLRIMRGKNLDFKKQGETHGNHLHSELQHQAS